MGEMSLAGAFAGLLQSPTRQIVERVKSVMQVREIAGGKCQYSWSGACAADLVRSYGVRHGLFQGFNSVLLREIPQYAIYYPSYAFFKNYYEQVSEI